MKKHTHFHLTLLAIIAVMFVACKKSDKDKIPEAFKTYAEANLANPSDFVEIASYEKDTTFSTADVKKSLASFNNGTLASFYKGCNRENGFSKYLEAHYKNKGKRYVQTESMLSNITKAVNIQYNVLGVAKLELLSWQNSLKQANDSTIFCYSVKCRIKQNGQLAIKDFYCVSDSALSKVMFYSSKEEAYQKNPTLSFISQCEEHRKYLYDFNDVLHSMDFALDDFAEEFEKKNGYDLDKASSK